MVKEEKPKGRKMKKVVISADMPEVMQNDAIRLAEEATERGKDDRDTATHLKDAFDTKYGPAWNCLVGTRYGTRVTHQIGNFIFFIVKNRAIMLFKSP